jgi:hypothetical protein
MKVHTHDLRAHSGTCSKVRKQGASSWMVKDMGTCWRVTDVDAHRMGSGHGCTLDG